MTDPHALDRLCALYGIAVEYTDQLGRHIVVPRATKIALLAAMGVRADSSADATRALEEREDQAWRRILAPVQVVRENEKPICIGLTLPAAQAARQLVWTLTLENGEQLRGLIRAHELMRLAERKIAGHAYVNYGFDLPHTPGCGYHRFELAGDGLTLNESMSLIVAPLTCYQPPVLSGINRVWGLAVQLYALRSRRNWGMGDYSDLKNLIETAGRAGAAIVGVNPLHALFPHHPAHASPYSPSSRQYHNILYLDVEAIADFGECRAARETVAGREFKMRLRAVRAATLVDYEAVAALKLPVLGQLYRHFCERHLACETSRGQAFQAFQTAGGDALLRQALFEALQEHFHAQDSSLWSWQKWPEVYRDPDSQAIAAFHIRHRERVEFYQYLQWQTELQLAAVSESSIQLKLGVGLYQDLAVSVDPGGADVWANQNLYALSASIGSPPDAISIDGQNWGLPPFNPQYLAQAAYAPFIAMLRTTMRHAGALRIDHVMGLMRLFWIPQGAAPKDGTYVFYPFADLLGILALESRRNQCLVVGEDLGNVPQQVPAALVPLGVLSYRLLYFEKSSTEDFKAPADYHGAALVAVSTHDLPTLAGFWQGADLATRAQLNLFPSDSYHARQVDNRAQERARLLLALEREQLLPASVNMRLLSMPEMSTELVAAIHSYLARTPAKVMVVQIEDLLGQVEQVNLPGTTSEYPNWRRKLSLTMEHWNTDARVNAVMEALQRERAATLRNAVPQ
ncbi:MAG: 4-alpha-glucanotransferase [Burkholderiales bacterium]